jgi:hypothetical protein
VLGSRQVPSDVHQRNQNEKLISGSFESDTEQDMFDSLHGNPYTKDPRPSRQLRDSNPLNPTEYKRAKCFEKSNISDENIILRRPEEFLDEVTKVKSSQGNRFQGTFKLRFQRQFQKLYHLCLFL